MSHINSLGKDYSGASQSKGNAVLLQKSRQSSGLGTVLGDGPGIGRPGPVGERRKKTGVLQGAGAGGLGDGASHHHENRSGQQNNININHQSNLQQFAQQQILNNTRNKAPPLNDNLNNRNPNNNIVDASFAMMRQPKSISINDQNGGPVQTNINNLTSDFDLCSPLNNNRNHNNPLQITPGASLLDVSSNTIDGGIPQPNNQAANLLDCSTLSTHSINDITSQTVKNSSSAAVSKANLHVANQAAQGVHQSNTGNQESPTPTAQQKSRRRTRERVSRMMNGLSANQGHHGVEDAASGGNRGMPGELTIFQSPQNNSFLGGSGGHAPHYDESLAQSNLDIMNSAGGVGGPRAHEGLSGVGATAPPGGYHGIQSTVNRKEKRFFQKKDLQLQTTIRKGKNTQPNMYILSPEQVKFNQGNLQRRFEEAEGGDFQMQNNFQHVGRRATSNNQNIGTESTLNNGQPGRKNSRSRTLHRNLDSDLQNIGDNAIMLQNQKASAYMAENLGGFNSVQAPNATVGGGELSGIGMLSANLMQSQETDQILRGINDMNESYHKPSAKMLGSNTNSYLNNSSVAKTAVHKRRNVSIGSMPGVNNPNDRSDGVDTAQHLNGISRPNISNTYDGSSTAVGGFIKTQNTLMGHTGDKYKNNHVNMNDSGLGENDRLGDRSQNSQMNNSSNNKYPDYIEELLQNSQRQFSQFGNGQTAASGPSNGMPNNNSYINMTNHKTGAGSSFNTHNNNPQNTSNLVQRIQNDSQNIHDANSSYLLQKQMNSSRFGGFRTADGASSGSKNQQNIHPSGGAFNNMTTNHQHGPQSPSSNQSFRVNVENRRARPKIVKTSQDHGNMFFIQQANSLKNSSQIGQRKDILSKMLPQSNNKGQSRGGFVGDTTSQGGITSATTAIGNQDENRSGHSGHENPHNVSGGGGTVHHQHSNSGNGVFGGDQSHKSISDRERTPTNKDQQQSHSSRREEGITSGGANTNALLSESTANKLREGAANGKQKDPYYFTFFNEKNEDNKENKDETDKATEQQTSQQTSIQQPAPTRPRPVIGCGRSDNNTEANILDTSVNTDYSNENIGGPVTQVQAKKSMLTKPQLKSKSKTRTDKSDHMQNQDRTENSGLGNHHNEQKVRESQNKSQITKSKGENEDNAILSTDNGYLKIQKQVMSSTPQKDMNQVKSKFDSNNDVANHSYQTLDQDTRRVNRPIRGNHHAGASGPSQGGKATGNPASVLPSKLMTNTTDDHNGYGMQEPTPSFNSQKQVSANGPDQTHQAPAGPSNNRKRQQAQAAAISSQNAFDNEYREAQSNCQNEQNQPSYTPVRRDPQNTYQRSKPQSPKILLPQCFLDQPLNQANGGMSAMNQHQAGRLAAGIQGVPGIGKVPGQPINTSNIGKITPISRDGNMGPMPQSSSGTTPPALQNRQKGDYHQIINSRENYVRQDLGSYNHYQNERNSVVPAQIQHIIPADGNQRGNILASISKHNRGSSVTPNLTNLTNDLSNYPGRNGNNIGHIGQSATGDISGQYRVSLPNQGITKSRQAPVRAEDSFDNDGKSKAGQSHAVGQAHLQSYLNSIAVPTTGKDDAIGGAMEGGSIENNWRKETMTN